MGLMLLVVIVAVGIAAVVAAVHLTGGSAPARFADEAAARERFALDFPDLCVGGIHLSRDRDAAFLALEDGRVGIVGAVGGNFLTRVVAAPDLAAAPRAKEDTLTLRLRDFTWSGGTFTFADEAEARAVEALFAAVRRVDRWEARG